MDDRRCNPRIAPQTIFRRSVRSIDYRLAFLDWEGNHKYRVEWIRPDGRLYDSQEFAATNYGGISWCDGEAIRGQDAQNRIGQWRLRVFVDGHLRRVEPFRLIRG
jgi:hypothetical protein